MLKHMAWLEGALERPRAAVTSATSGIAANGPTRARDPTALRRARSVRI